MGQRRGPGGRFLGVVNSFRHKDLTSNVNRIARAKAMKSIRWDGYSLERVVIVNLNHKNGVCKNFVPCSFDVLALFWWVVDLFEEQRSWSGAS